MILKKMQSVTSLLSHRMPQGMLLKTKGYCSSPESCCSCTKTTKHPNFQLMLEWPALCPGCQKRTTFFPTEICLTRSVKLLNPHSSPHKAFCLVHQLHSYYSRVNVIIFFVSFFLKCWQIFGMSQWHSMIEMGQLHWMKPGKNQLTDIRCLRGQNTAVKESRGEGVGEARKEMRVNLQRKREEWKIITGEELREEAVDGEQNEEGWFECDARGKFQDKAEKRGSELEKGGVIGQRREVERRGRGAGKKWRLAWSRFKKMETITEPQPGLVTSPPRLDSLSSSSLSPL